MPQFGGKLRENWQRVGLYRLVCKECVGHGKNRGASERPWRYTDFMKPPTESKSFEPPAKWRAQYDALVRLRDTLLGESAEHEAALRAPREKGGTDAVDVAENESEFGEHLALLRSEQAGLAEIEAALGRIRSGTYGRCEVTGEPIPAARLRVLPWTRLSTAAARKTEVRKSASK